MIYTIFNLYQLYFKTEPLQITGLNLRTHHFVEQLIEWTMLGHRYTEKQTEDLNQAELKWVCKGKQVSKLQYQYFTISSREDLLFHLSLKKGSILSRYMGIIQQQIDISDYVLKMNGLLEQIALVYQQINLDKNLNLSYQVKPIQIKEINSTYLEPLISLNQLQSLEFMSTDELFEEIIRILEVSLLQSEKPFLLKLNHLGKLLDGKKLQEILSRLYQLSVKYPLEIINIAQTSEELLMNEEVVESIIVCGERIEQLEDYASIKDYSTRNYPKIYDDDQLLSRLQRIVPYLFTPKGSHYVSSYLDQVCFVLLNQGMGYFEYQSLEVEKVNTLEWNFLRNHLYK